jgi:hypothetical protein
VRSEMAARCNVRASRAKATMCEVATAMANTRANTGRGGECCSATSQPLTSMMMSSSKRSSSHLKMASSNTFFFDARNDDSSDHVGKLFAARGTRAGSGVGGGGYG